MLTRDRRPMPAGLPLLPAPAPLQSLSSALQRRAAVLGPLDLNEPSAASLEP